MKIITFILFVTYFFLVSFSAQAGRIYRFMDKDGVSTLSKDLPPYAAQKGYDILDDKSLRLIERVYSREDLIEIQKKQRIEEQKKQAQLKRQQEARKKLLKQRSKDRNLIARYPTEEVLLKARDEDLQYRENRIKELKAILVKNEKNLEDLQSQAAAAEIDGEPINDELKKQISDIKTEIQKNKQQIQKIREEKQKIKRQYQAEHARLRELLARLKESKKASQPINSNPH